jgi:hypothetical protein
MSFETFESTGMNMFNDGRTFLPAVKEFVEFLLIPFSSSFIWPSIEFLRACRNIIAKLEGSFSQEAEMQSR